MMNQKYMQRALILAAKGRGRVSPNPMVGCVIVKKNKVIAEGWHKCFGGDHAEIDAIKGAKINLKGSTMYVSLEPCFHQGKTPPCVDAIIQKGIKKIFIAMKDPNPLTCGKTLSKLKRAGVQVEVGLLKEEAAKLNEAFLKYISTGMPFVTVKSAQTLDGKIATAKKDSRWITSQKTRMHTRKKRDHYDAILVGINTVLRDNPRLSGFLSDSKVKTIVVDSSLRVSLQANIFKVKAPQQCIIATTQKASLNKINFLKQEGVEILLCPQKEDSVDLKWLFKALAKMGIIHLLIEGGAHVIGSALKNKLVDKMEIYLAPKILGDAKALSSIVGCETSKISKAFELENINVKKIDQDIEVSGYVLRNR